MIKSIRIYLGKSRLIAYHSLHEIELKVNTQVIKSNLNLAWQVEANRKQVACMNQIENKHASK